MLSKAGVVDFSAYFKDGKVAFRVRMGKKLKKFWAWLKADRRRLAATAIVLIVILLGGWRLLANKKNGQTQYQTAQVTKGTIVSSISASGQVLTTNVLNITTSASGVVKKVYVKDGDNVYAGQKIAELTLDSNGLKTNASNWSSYLSAKSAVENANISYYSLQSAMFAANQKFINDAAARSLATDDPTYIQEYADWKASELKFNNNVNTLNQAKSSLNAAWLTYQSSSAIITAPYAGKIDNVDLIEGMVVGQSSDSSISSNQKIATVVKSGSPIISVTLSEVDVPKVKVGQKAIVTFDTIPDKTFSGVVGSVDKIGTVSSNVTSYGTKIKLDSASNEILPNMAATANIILETKTDVLMIPSAAVTSQNGQTYAKTLKDGKETDVAVETGISSDTEIEIVSGLEEGQEVITETVSSTSSSSSQGTSIFSTRGFGGGAGAIRRVD